MVTTMREREVFLLLPAPNQPDRPNRRGKQNGWILVVEDDAATHRLERVIMEEEGYRVEVVGSGEAALDFLAENSPSLVLLDIGLPGIDGFDTCAKIRETSEVPIIMVTGLDCLDDKVKGMDGGADDYVTKPFLTPELATRVKVVLRRAHRVRDEQPRVGESAQAIPATDKQHRVGEFAQETTESTEDSTALPSATSELPGNADQAVAIPTPTATPIAANPTATARNYGTYEGTVRLTITTLGPVRNLINFVSELRQSPKFRLLRLVANQRTEGMDIWLGLRGPIPLVELLTTIHGVHAVVPGDIPDIEASDQLLMVTLD